MTKQKSSFENLNFKILIRINRLLAVRTLTEMNWIKVQGWLIQDKGTMKENKKKTEFYRTWLIIIQYDSYLGSLSQFFFTTLYNSRKG